MEGFDFSGYATKAGLKCSDGRTITAEAFAHMDGMRVPLVYQHVHTDVKNVLGHAILEARPDGVYAYGFLNKETEQGQIAHAMVRHGDVDKLSIYANQLKEHAKRVLHGVIREVSIVLSGANPGARIDFIQLQHSDGVDVLEDEAIIHTGLDLEVPDEDEDDEQELAHAERTVQDVYNTFTEEQKRVVHFMLAQAVELAEDGELEQSDNTGETLEHQEGHGDVTANVFDQNKTKTDAGDKRHVLTHSDVKSIVGEAQRLGSLKKAMEGYALQHGVENIESLFPDPRMTSATPQWDTRRMEWVDGVINNTRKVPWARIKQMSADLTQEMARAKGYIKGSYKKEQWFKIVSRITTPTTIYKKQKVDRDDIIDITDFDFVAWLKAEIRVMLKEEVAISILIGDGRDPGDEDKVKDPGDATEGAGIRAIANEHELYAHQFYIDTSDYENVVEELLLSRQHYKGSGSPTLYTTENHLNQMLLLKDTTGRRMYSTEADLRSALRVSAIVTVEAMEREPAIVGILVNLNDYAIGSDRGGEVTMFDDFDIDYNQFKYLMETRLSGALDRIKSAIVYRTADTGDTLVVPNQPTFNATTGVVTIVATTGVTYKNDVTDATLSTGAQSALAAGATLRVRAEANSGYRFANSVVDGPWEYQRPYA